MHDVANHDPYFVQTDDASGRVGLSTEQKLTCAMRMLAYRLPADLCDEFLDVAESTALEILSHFTRAISNVYHDQYLRRPTPTDLQRLLDVADKRGFPGMVGSLDCMHWQWKNCPTSWQGHFTGYKGKPTIILEAVASYDAWIGTPILDFQVPLMILMYLECLHYSMKYAQVRLLEFRTM
ncbi:putative harbinger transposase-derived protein [Rosa chinensis]|uniref:Putative harbinger transposase-derived protein n=1 Tax=Rosa chinensis TaxID=74649 RepID=A0A2P6RZM0_ROSCH|nr:putative harbinger transposase-derived protein [Rosa chinensis]